MTAPRQFLDRSEEQWIRAFLLDGMPEAAARRQAAELIDGADRARAAGGKIFWDLPTVLPMACADLEFGRRILEIFEPALDATDEDDGGVTAEERADAAAAREQLAQQLARVRAFVARSGGLREPAG